MNILIVGNGFDLSHYLPTKYDHFMVAMGAIENWDEQKGEMQFDDLFGSLYEKENYFFKYTKAMYQTDEIKISTEQVKKLKQKLKENVWYQYFSDHVREIKTWIDFEQKIEEALI
ncbi:AbiH family protein, partial [Acinetobacter baumannii]